VDRRRLQLVAAAAPRRRLGIGADDLVAGFDQGAQDDDGKFGCAEEGETHGERLALGEPARQFEEPGAKLRRFDADFPKELIMRSIVVASILGLAIAVTACSRAEQQQTEADTRQAGNELQANAAEAGDKLEVGAKDVGADVKEGAQKAGAEIKDVANDPDVKAAAGEVKDAFKSLGTAVKDAGRETKEGAQDAGAKAKDAAN